MDWLKKYWGRISHVTLGIVMVLLGPWVVIPGVLLVIAREAMQEMEYRAKDQKLAILNRSWVDMCEWLVGIIAGGIISKALEVWIWQS